MSELLHLSRQVAREAGDIIQDVRSGDLGVETKDDESPVTVADKRASEHIKDRLRSETGIAYLDEEAGFVDGDGDRYWLVDPLDGTKDFIRGSDEYTVNIALVNEQEPVMGVVYAPATNTMYYGDGDHAYRVEDGGETEELVSDDVSVADAIAAVSKSHPDDDLNAFLDMIGVEGLRGIGSSLKGCRVADGTVHCYPRFHGLYAWDIAAMHAVLRSASCKMTTWDDTPLSYDAEQPGMRPFVAAPPSLHKDLCEAHMERRKQ